ncbi:MAG: tetratricopeptide repeat protein [Acidobacteriota bacterium]
MDERDDRWERQWQLFHDASEADDPEAWLAAHCDDPALVHRVLELLEASEAADTSFLPTDGVGVRRENEPTRELTPGDRVGPYELLELLGEGGMGRVFLAQQREPLERRVALKVIRPGFETAELLARFDAERRILVRLAHPHVAGVLDAGVVPDGRPFFVMEAVDGLPIDVYCRRRGLEVEDRLELMITVCEAVQHAHHKGVIHRDLKPSNVLVGEIDGRPTPKVIDFGIAKLLSEAPPPDAPADGGSVADGALVTAVGRVLGTPTFMSPEQVSETGAGDVDSRTDVYALGVLLSYLERGGPPASAAAGPRTDLDWIIAKATTASRDGRYATCSELAADLRRHLERRPVLAAPFSWRDRLGKLARRHRLAASILAASLAILCLLIVGLTFQTLRLRAALDEASAESARRGQVTEFLVDLFQGSDPEIASSPDRSAREVLDEGAERILADLDDPSLSLPLTLALGEIYGNLGEFERQVEMLETALSSQERTDAEPTAIGDTLDRLGAARSKAGDWPGAEHDLLAALEHRRRELGEDHLDTLATRRALGSLYFRLGRYEESRLILEDVLARHTAAGRGGQLEVGRAHHSLGNLMYETENYDTAREHYLQGHTIFASALPADDRRVAGALNGLARIHERFRENAEAESLYRQVLSVRSKKLGPDHPEIAAYRTNLAMVLLRLNRFTEARELSAVALETFEAALGSDHPNTFHVATNHGLILFLDGRPLEALAILRRVQLGMEAMVDLGNGVLRSNLGSQGRILVETEQWQEAIEPLERLMAYYESAPGISEAARMRDAELYGEALLYTGRRAEGERWLERALEHHLEAYGAADERTLAAWERLEAYLRQRGDTAALETWLGRLEQRSDAA